MEIEKRVRKEGGHMSYYVDVCPCSVVCVPRPIAASSARPAGPRRVTGTGAVVP